MVRPAQCRLVLAWAQQAYGLAERRTCRTLGISRSSIRYRSRKPDRQPLRTRLREMAAIRVSYGYKRLHVLLRREGWRVNHKLVHRLYLEEGLALKRKKLKRRKSAVPRAVRPVTTAADQRWAMDFIHDVLADGRTIRILSVVDVFSRECVGLVAKTSFRGEDVARILGEIGRERALPPLISVDNGTEFTSRALDHWAYWNQVRLDFSRPGKPTDNAHVEAFHGSLRRECLSQHWFLDLADAQQTLDAWREDYNKLRPHSSLGNLPPAHFRSGGHFIPTRERLQI